MVYAPVLLVATLSCSVVSSYAAPFVVLHGMNVRLPTGGILSERSAGEGKHIRQTGGHGQYGNVWIKIGSRMYAREASSFSGLIERDIQTTASELDARSPPDVSQEDEPAPLAKPPPKPQDKFVGVMQKIGKLFGRVFGTVLHRELESSGIISREWLEHDDDLEARGLSYHDLFERDTAATAPGTQGNLGNVMKKVGNIFTTLFGPALRRELESSGIMPRNWFEDDDLEARDLSYDDLFERDATPTVPAPQVSQTPQTPQTPQNELGNVMRNVGHVFGKLFGHVLRRELEASGLTLREWLEEDGLQRRAVSNDKTATSVSPPAPTPPSRASRKIDPLASFVQKAGNVFSKIFAGVLRRELELSGAVPREWLEDDELEAREFDDLD